MLRPMRHVLAALLAFSFAGCETFGNLNLYSDEELEPLSAQAYAEVSSEYKVIESGPQYQMVRTVAQKITAACDENFDWQVKLLQADDTPNAFCLPNGRIAVYTGILPLTQNADGLAAVVGHEVAHAVLRHGGKRMTQGLLTSVAAAAVDAGLGFSEMEQDTRGVVMSVIGAGAQYGVLLPYSREHETEADVLGLRYLVRAGYDPYEAPKLWERMAELGGDTPEWMSTHPHPLARAEKLRELIPQIIEEEKGWQPGTKK